MNQQEALQTESYTVEMELVNKNPKQQNIQNIESKPEGQIQFSQVHHQNTKYGESVRLDFVDVCYDVQTKQGKKRILHNVSGYVKPGEILYIMGPSGGGKTSLIDYLCNRTKKTPQGNVFLNHGKWTESEFKTVAKYCKQHPQLYEVLTVQETLDYAASFYTKTAEERKLRVDNVIAMLGLEAQRHVKVGGLFYRGISGGQKQRVSVGEQLVANPKILFLDEPTSGLDSASAFKLMQNLKEIARKTQITIISSIHQPSQRVFELSDRLIVLAGGKQFGGHTAYFGRTEHLQAHFDELGIKNEGHSSPSEWILDEVNGDFADIENIRKIVDSFKNSSQKKHMDDVLKYGFELTQNPEKQKNMDVYRFDGENSKASTLVDGLNLLGRGIKTNIKNPLALGIKLVSYCFMAFIIGSVWWQVGDNPKAGDIQNINGAIFFVAAFFTFMCVSSLPVMIEDRQIMTKERSNGAYNLFAYSISNFIVSLPFTFILSLTSGAITFFMLGLENDGGDPFIMFVINIFISLLAAESMVLLIGYQFDNLLISIILASQNFSSFMMMCGFFIKTSDIPDGWLWLHYIAFYKYSFKIFAHGAFNNMIIGKDLNTVPPALTDIPGKVVLADMDMEDVDVGANILILLLFIFIFRGSAVLYSYFKHTGKK